MSRFGWTQSLNGSFPKIGNSSNVFSDLTTSTVSSSELQPDHITPHQSGVGSFTWSPEANAAFYKLKKLFTSTHILSHPDPEKRLILEVDTLDFGLVVVLSQWSEYYI